MLERIIFLSYINRSGSTYLANLLGKHNKICSIPEAEILIFELLTKPEKRIKKKDIKFLKLKILNNTKIKEWGLPIKQLESIISNSYTKTCFTLFFEILELYILTYKPHSPIALFKGTRLSKLFKKKSFYIDFNVNLINILRDGRAAFASQKRSLSSLTGKPMTDNIVGSALEWKKFAKGLIKKDIGCTIKYEELLLYPQYTFKNILNYLNIEYSLNQNIDKEYSIKLPESQMHLHQNINKPPDTNKINNWKNELSDYEINTYNLIAARQLKFYEYEINKTIDIKVLKYLIFFFLKLVFTKKILQVKTYLKKGLKKIIYRSAFA
jgi:hypothetical protein